MNEPLIYKDMMVFSITHITVLAVGLACLWLHISDQVSAKRASIARLCLPETFTCSNPEIIVKNDRGKEFTGAECYIEILIDTHGGTTVPDYKLKVYPKHEAPPFPEERSER